jgi:lipopolysaccharide transport system ATP-binding protein
MLVLKAENISKQYRLGQVGTGTLSHDLNRMWHKMRGKDDPYLKIGETNNRAEKGKSEYVWSLQNINFEIEQGDAVGIIGRNGAGKSTLLKLLSRVTKPTSGKIYTRGRIASLLEVGTGFHPEMTGRENVYLNGAILGMTRKEISRKFDEIVDFSGVERYIDTPVKRYSSGMYVRLAFAVAAHLESEILIVDEVLAVGDAEFQKKCLGKMGDVTKGEGRTVLFVSHNMTAVKTLCSNGILLEKGMVKYTGNIDKCVSYYLGNSKGNEYIQSFDIGTEKVRIKRIEVKNSGANDSKNLYENQEIELITDINVLSENPERYHLTYVLNNEQTEPLFSLSHYEQFPLKPGDQKIKCTFPAKYFQSGNYYLSLYIIEDRSRADFIESDIFTFIVEDAPREIGAWTGREPGYIRPTFKWNLY